MQYDPHFTYEQLKERKIHMCSRRFDQVVCRCQEILGDPLLDLRYRYFPPAHEECTTLAKVYHIYEW